MASWSVRRAVGIGGAFLVLVAFLSLSTRAPEPGGRVLEVQLQSSAGTAAKIYWDAGTGFSEGESLQAPFVHTSDGDQIARLALPNVEIRRLRFLPTNAGAEVLVRRMEVHNASGTVTATLNPANLIPYEGVASMVRDGSGAHITTSPGSTSPALMITASCLDGPAAWYDPFSVTPLSLIAVALLTCLLLAASGWRIVRELFERDLPMAERSRDRAWRATFWMIVLFGITLCAKLYLLHESTTPVPWLDQWVSEPILYVSFAERCLSWRDMFALHNEHRIFFSKMLALSLFAANNQWDPQLQQVVNAVMHAATATLLAVMLYLTQERRRADFAVLTCAVMFAVPFNWENVIFGFQSSFYLFVLFSILAIGLTLRNVPGSLAWTLGWICAGASLFAAGGGLATVALVSAATTVKTLWYGQPTRHLVANLAFAAGALTLGVWTMSPPLEYHAPLRAATLEDFVLAAGRNLAWPWGDRPWLCFLVWAPLILLIVIRLAGRHAEAAKREWWMYAIGAWTVMNAVLLAYARGADGAIPSSRYMDFFSLGAVANMGAVSSLVGLLPRPAASRRVAVVALTAWVVMVLAGVDHVTRDVFVNFRGVQAWMVQHTANLRQFIVTDDLAAFAVKKFPDEVPYFDPRQLANAWLRHPYIRATLPPAIRAPLILQPARITDEAFVRNGVYPTTPLDPERPTWGSFAGRQNASVGTFESAVVDECPRPFLRFDVAGYLTDGELSVGTQRPGSGNPTLITPPALAREQWLPTFAWCNGPFEVVAKDADAGRWFAFRDPVEYGIWSWVARRCVDYSYGGLLGFVALALVALRAGAGPSSLTDAASAPRTRSAAP